ncbi:hypothetical protein [Mucilaginibacter myungsuensis]|uniref:DUF5723 domain-containing protein n=1 Tax=Mucilaginibacter myungsuensis TaxID=649104 RepID=A0A929KWP4_9SPHI|nr:hypothetical protein [Mucilaginibacter myungsuensis]MBE9661313.1 hypothetical protein [Mucilaginibacter myungsuensis]MDN3597456.1 hypothetical protein [Mucilaginibacter myungsuensis]
MKKQIIIYIILLSATGVFAQNKPMDHSMHNMGGMEMKKDTTPKTMDHSAHGAPMSSSYSKDLPMNRDGSGTSWQPDASPMYAYMFHGKKWMSMLHGSVYARYNRQDVFNSGSRGAYRFDAPNMLMGMTQRNIGKNGLFAVHAMLSLDPFTVGNGGYPLLYQSGEAYKGSKLVDKQHPHDLFSALTVSYAQHIAKDADAYISFGYPGEPALGPPVFMHRLSALSNPDAPLSHHYADATHITFGTTTLGFRYKDVKIEGSVFTGREPNEKRYDFDEPKFDSYSVRLSYNPSKEWALQVSNGWLHSPEELDPHDNVTRTTASAIYTKMLSDDSFIASTFVYGQNNAHGKTRPSALLESTLQLSKTAIYGRYELVSKDANELDLLTTLPTNPTLNINALTLGASRILGSFKKTDLRAGLQATANFSPNEVRSLYGTAPMAVQVYLRISPAMMKMGGKHKMPMKDTGKMVM